MTRDKAQKTATRQRMAETGEPYSVARKATQAGTEGPGLSETPAEQDPRGTLVDQGARETPVEQSTGETPEEQYLREAEEAGVAAADLEMLRLFFQARERAGQVRQVAERARERAEQAEEAAVRAEERAELAQETADLAQDWADKDEQRLARERADRRPRGSNGSVTPGVNCAGSS